MTNKQTRNVFQNSAANPLPTAFCGRQIPLPADPQNGVKGLIGNKVFPSRGGFAGLPRIFSLPAGKEIRGQP